MTNLSPGSVQTAVRTARLLVTLDRESARTATLALADSQGVSLRPGKPGLWVLEAQGAGSATVRLLASDQGGAAMVGAAELTIRSVPVSAGVADGLEWVVTELRPEGRRTLDVLAVSHDTSDNWTMRSLLASTRPLDPDPASQAARQYLGDQAPITMAAMVAVDRSASMAWAYRHDGELHAVLRGLWAAVTHTLTQEAPITWTSFGSGVGPDGPRIVPEGMGAPDTSPQEPEAAQAASQLLDQLRPELFASGSDPAAVAAHAGRSRVGVAFIVTDCLPPATPAPGPGAHLATIVLGMTSGGRLPADEAAALRAAQDNGIAVLAVAPSRAGQGEPDPVAITRWAIDQLLAGAARQRAARSASRTPGSEA